MTTLGYYLLFGFAWLISLIPFRVMYWISDLLYFVNFYLIGYRKKIVYKNLRLSFPDKTFVEIDHIAKTFYRHFSDFLLESIKCLSIPLKQHEKRFRFTNMEVIRQLENEGKDFALVSAHYNNWEWMIFFPAKMVHKFLAIYRPLQNKTVDRLSRRIRGRYNPVLVPMEHVFREALKYRSENRRYSIWFLADQRPPRANRFWTTFLNQEISFFEGVEKISRKLGLTVIFLDIQKSGRGYYEARFTKLFDNAAQTNENEVMLTCIREMEKEIVTRPEYWLWSHNRFKYTRPEHFNLITS
jgi:Kdo2-lipid IVA lauroyltransferase/acyltransferase